MKRATILLIMGVITLLMVGPSPTGEAQTKIEKQIEAERAAYFEKEKNAAAAERYLAVCERVIAYELWVGVKPFLLDHEQKFFASEHLFDIGSGLHMEAQFFMFDCEKRIRIALNKEVMDDHAKRKITSLKAYEKDLAKKMQPYLKLFTARSLFQDARRDVALGHANPAWLRDLREHIDPLVPVKAQEEEDAKFLERLDKRIADKKKKES